MAPPLSHETLEVPAFDRGGLVAAIRRDQAGEGTFPEFLSATWQAGVIRYEVDFRTRTVRYGMSPWTRLAGGLLMITSRRRKRQY